MSNLQSDLGDRNPPSKPGGWGATIFLFLFSLPFAGFGVLALVQGVRKWTAGNVYDGPFLCLFGFIFSFVGFGLMLLSFWVRKNSRQTAELQARFPDKPWMQQPDWAAGKIKSKSTSAAGFFLVWSILALALSAPAVAQIPKEWHKGNYAILLALLFPVVAFGLIGYTVQLWRAHRRFGDCFFEPAQVPIPIGGVLEGMIQTSRQLKLEHEMSLTFSCVRRVVSGSGKSRSVSESPLWQTEKNYSEQAVLPEPEPGHTRIPVHFVLPDDQPECYSRGDESVFWRLEAKSKMRGPHFHAIFDLPVFKVAGVAGADSGDAGAADSDPTASLQAPIEEIRRDEHSRIKVTDGPGGREFYFPAARNPGTALFMTLAAFAFIGFAAASWHFHAPMLFPILFGLVGSLMLLGAFGMWFKSSRVTIDPTTIRVTNDWLIFSRERRFATADIAWFAARPGMQSGTKVYTNIRLVTREGQSRFAAEKDTIQGALQSPDGPVTDKVVAQFRQAAGPSGVTVAGNIASVAEANWLVAQMNTALGRGGK